MSYLNDLDSNYTNKKNVNSVFFSKTENKGFHCLKKRFFKDIKTGIYLSFYAHDIKNVKFPKTSSSYYQQYM